MITTTLKQIRSHSPCSNGYKKLCKSLGSEYGEDTPVTFEQILQSNGTADAVWCLRATPKETHHLWRHFAVDCAEMVSEHLKDPRSLNALKVARDHADGKATDAELAAARDAAGDAAWDAAGDAAWDAAWDAAGDAAWDVAWAAAGAAARDAAGDAAWDVAWDVAWAAAGAAQGRLLLLYTATGERPENSAELLQKFYQEELQKCI